MRRVANDVDQDHTKTAKAADHHPGSHPDYIGPYKILENIGEGGMGSVYVAEQREPVRRRVALKVIKLGMDTKQVLARFEVEQHALTIMNHPNIARVYDAGATPEGRPYFVMEHVPGIAITDYCDRNRLPNGQRLGLFISICHAVQHAHQKGVIHRDLKPSNILVMIQDGKPVPKIIDFGVAKATGQRLTERTLYTELGQLVGTTEYMSPEQAEMTAIDIDTRTDIYSLGVILYELLVGSLPFAPKSLRQAGLAEIQRIIREVDPPKPSTRFSSLGAKDSTAAAQHRRTDVGGLQRTLRGDLDWIIMKALEKDRSRRYETANGLALDILRHIENEPVLASPPGAGYRIGKFIRRNRGLVTSAVVVFVVLVAGITASTIFAIGQARARSSEAEQRRIAQAAEINQTRARRVAERARSEAAQRGEKRARQLKILTEFQQSMLGGIDAEKMGRGIIVAQREDIRERLESDGIDPEEVETALASFDGLVAKINPTNLALKVLDENVLSRAVETIRNGLVDQALVRDALAQTVADTYRELGLYERAMPLQQAGLETLRNELGNDHPDTLASIDEMGLLLHLMGKNGEADPYYREALEGRRRVLGDDHADTRTSMDNMGYLLQSMGKLAEAEPYYREVLQGRRSVLGDDQWNTLTSINNMGYLLKSMGKLAEAELYYREALEGRRSVLGDDHPDTLTSINNMGDLLKSMGKLAEAEPYYREALEGRRSVLGDDHPATIWSLNDLVVVLKDQSKLDDARTHLAELITLCRRRADKPEATAHHMNSYAWLLLTCEPTDLRDPEKALPIAKKAVELTWGEDPYILDTLALAYKMTGNLDKAIETQRKAVGLLPPGESAGRREFETTLFEFLKDKGDLAEAEQLYRDILVRRRANLPAGDPAIGSSLVLLGLIIVEQEKFAETEVAFLEAHEILESTLGPEHDRTINTIKVLIDLYDAWHEADPDQGYGAKAAEWRAKLPEDNGE